MRRSPIRRRSKKREAYYRDTRRPLVEKMLKGTPVCEAGPVIWVAGYDSKCQRVAVDVHERKRRSQGGSLEDPVNLMRVCRLCHGWIDAHPAVSYHLGLLVKSWDEVRPLGEYPREESE